MKIDKIDLQVKQWHEVRPDIEPEIMGLFARLLRVSNHISKGIWDQHKSMGLSKGDFDILATLRRNGEPYIMTPTDLYKSTMLTSGAITNRLDKLEKTGWIERTHSQHDRRSYLVKLSDQGMEKIDNSLLAHVENEHALSASLTQKQKSQLDALLKIWLIQFEGELDSAD
ncbi:MarR family winged helix-turn-helix transcriptional regulator [Moritella yayanosii]|uniref:Transcriptional regulator n=1 Tax=Moritella yayanosii TaxID=69539 RepID=A0A330LTS9_9GAMM|nr:MarR family transcriptional regulator [Moritella yayanosii]SQD79792.1 Transcriptional regulator [Moritella yayanosii]